MHCKIHNKIPVESTQKIPSYLYIVFNSYRFFFIFFFSVIVEKNIIIDLQVK